MVKLILPIAVTMSIFCTAHATPEEKFANENASLISNALSLESEARKKVVNSAGIGFWGLRSAELTDSVALDINGNILSKAFGSAGYVRLIFENGLRRCAITIQTRLQVIVGDNVTCTGERP